MLANVQVAARYQLGCMFCHRIRLGKDNWVSAVSSQPPARGFGVGLLNHVIDQEVFVGYWLHDG